MKKCANCPTLIAVDGPTRCKPCAQRNAARTKAKQLNDPNYPSRRAEWVAKNRERTNALRRVKHVSRARTKTCIDCHALLPRKGPDRCPSHHEIHKKQQEAKRNAKWIRKNPDKNRIRSMRRYARKKGAKGMHTAAEWQALLELTGHVCLRCGGRQNIEADHIIPLALGGEDSIANIQPLCRSCNAQKRLGKTDYRSRQIRTAVVEWSGVPESHRQQATLDV